MNSGRWGREIRRESRPAVDDGASGPKSCGIRSSAQQNSTDIVQSLYLLVGGAKRTLRNSQILRNSAGETSLEQRRFSRTTGRD